MGCYSAANFPGRRPGAKATEFLLRPLIKCSKIVFCRKKTEILIMKKLILCFSFIGLLSGLYAQAGADEAREATRQAAAYYQLNEQQAAEMYVIQQRRLRNLASIESLREVDYSLYLQKKNSAREGMMASIQRMLDEQQMEAFNRQLAERRKKESALIQELKQEGASREEIQLAIWQLE